MTPYYSFASYLHSSFYDALVLQVWTMLQFLQRCNRGSDMYNDLKFTLEVVDELGRLKLAEALVEAANIHTQVPGRSGQSGGSRGGRRHGGGRAGPERATKPKPIYEEGDESAAEESWLQGDWVFFDDGARPSHPAGDAAGPSRTMSCGASQEYKAPRQSPICHPQCSVDPPMMVDAYLSPHQACPPHL
nr:hypothetical protein CFP56_43613 [Quercus suber]